MDAYSLIELFGKESCINLSLGESGTVDLVFENGVTLTLEHDDPQDLLHCYVVLGRIPTEDSKRLTVYGDLLEANLFGHETDGATLGVDKHTGEVLLSWRLELLDANVSLLRNIVQKMVNVAVVWREYLGTVDRGDVKAPKLSNNKEPQVARTAPQSYDDLPRGGSMRA